MRINKPSICEHSIKSNAASMRCGWCMLMTRTRTDRFRRGFERGCFVIYKKEIKTRYAMHKKCKSIAALRHQNSQPHYNAMWNSMTSHIPYDICLLATGSALSFTACSSFFLALPKRHLVSVAGCVCVLMKQLLCKHTAWQPPKTIII